MIDYLQDAPPELCYTSSFVCYKQVTPSGGSNSMELQISLQTLCPLVANDGEREWLQAMGSVIANE